MPIYEYRCQQGHTFDVMRRISDEPLTACQVCSAPVERVFRPIAVHFKGSGFYNTDYGTRKRSREMTEQKETAKSESANGAKTSGGDSGASSSDKSKSDSKSETTAKKPESKPDAGKAKAAD